MSSSIAPRASTPIFTTDETVGSGYDSQHAVSLHNLWRPTLISECYFFSSKLGVHLSKPKPSRALLVVGILLWFLAAFVGYAVPSLVTAYFVSQGGQTVAVNFFPLVVAGSAAFLVGMIFVVVGVGRAAAGMDYLVSVAREPALSSTHDAYPASGRLPETGRGPQDQG
jgi:hypothetical protein